jgi:hypothetical protein
MGGDRRHRRAGVGVSSGGQPHRVACPFEPRRGVNRTTWRRAREERQWHKAMDVRSGATVANSSSCPQTVPPVRRLCGLSKMDKTVHYIMQIGRYQPKNVSRKSDTDVSYELWLVS